MDNLLKQIAKFGVVGVVCFFVDFIIYTLLNAAFRRTGFAFRYAQYYLLSKLVSVIVSMIANYLLSMKFVFNRREDLSRKREFAIFVVLSVMGLALSELILYIGMGLIDPHWTWFRRVLAFWADTCGLQYAAMEETFWVLLSTGIVMCYNFASRKLTLEGRQGASPEPDGAHSRSAAGSRDRHVRR